MISKPQRGDDITAWCQRLWADLQPVFNANVSSRMTLRKLAPAWLFDVFENNTLALTPLSVGVKDTGDNPAFVRICTGYCVINQDTRADWIKAPNTSDDDVQPAFYDLDLVTGYNFIYAQLELIKADGTIDGDGSVVDWDFSGSSLSFAKKHCDEKTGIDDVLKSIKTQTTTFLKLLCAVKVTAPEAGATQPNVKLLAPLYHSGNWEFVPALIKKQFCEGDPPGPVDAAIVAVMLGPP